MSPNASRQSTGKMTNRPFFAHIPQFEGQNACKTPGKLCQHRGGRHSKSLCHSKFTMHSGVVLLVRQGPLGTGGGGWKCQFFFFNGRRDFSAFSQSPSCGWLVYLVCCEPSGELQESLRPSGPEIPKKSEKSLPGPPAPGSPKVWKKSRKSPEQTFSRLFPDFSRLFPDFSGRLLMGSFGSFLCLLCFKF